MIAGGGLGFADANQEVGAAACAIGRHAAMNARQQAAQDRIVVAGNDHAVERDTLHELQEGAADVAHVAVAVHVLAVDVGDDREDRRELQKGPVAFVGFGDQVLRLAEAGVGAHGVHAPADDDSRVETAGREDRRDHRSRRRLAVHAGDGNAVLEAHQFRQHFGARDYWNVQAAGFRDLGIVNRNGGTGDNYVDSGDIRRSVPFESRCTHRCQALGDGRAFQVGAGDLVAKVQQDLGNTAHADATDADEMDALDLGEHNFISAASTRMNADDKALSRSSRRTRLEKL